MNIDLIPDRKEFKDKTVKYGFVDSKGTVKIPYIYEFALPFSNNLAGVRNYNNHLMGFIDSSNNARINFEYEYVYPFVEDATWMRKNGLWGLISNTNEEIIRHMYKKATPFKNNVAIVQRTDNKWGLIDRENNEICDFIYDWINSKDNKLFNVYIDGKWEYKEISDMKSNKILKLDK